MCNPGARERLSRRSCRPLGCRTLLRWYADMGTHAWEHALSLHTRLPWERIRRARRPQRAARACEIPSRGAASSRPRRALRCRCAAQRDLVARSYRGRAARWNRGWGKGGKGARRRHSSHAWSARDCRCPFFLTCGARARLSADSLCSSRQQAGQGALGQALQQLDSKGAHAVEQGDYQPCAEPACQDGQRARVGRPQAHL